MLPRTPAILVAVLLAPCAAFGMEICDAPAPTAPIDLATAQARFLACNRDLRAAERAVDATRADRIVAGQRPNPTLTLGASNINPQAGVGSGPLRGKTLDSSARIEQLVERGNKGGLRERQGDLLIAASRADYQEATRQGRAQFRQAFFELALQQERSRLLGEFAGLSADSARASQRRFEAGDISAAESNRIRLDAVRAVNDLRVAEIDRAKARNDLARLLAFEASAATLSVREEFDAIAESQPVAGDLRPDVIAARRRMDAAEAARDLAASIAVRDVTVGAQVDHWPASPFNPQGTGISYGITVSVPLHVRHANEGELKRASVDFQAARETWARVQAVASSEATLAQMDWEAARERRVRVEADVLPVAREVARGAEFAYARGATSVLDLLDARRSLKQAELEAIAARSEAAKAWARREAALETLRDAGSESIKELP